MIKSLTITNHLGDSIELELARPDKTGFIVESIDGLGPATANINMTDVATIDGSLYNSSRLDRRDIVMNLKFMETKTETIEDIRQKSYRYFPIGRKVNIRIKTDNRELLCEGYVNNNEPNIFSNEEGTSITILCPDPYLYSPVVTTTVFSGIEPTFEFPFENNSLTESLLQFGSIETKNEKYVYYEGEIEIGVTIRIHAIGEATDIAIYNVTTGERMVINTTKLATLTGSGIIAGDTIVIDTRKRNRTITLIRDGDEINIFNVLDKGTPWFTLNQGYNVFLYKASTGSSNLYFSIENATVYGGV